MSKLGHAGGHAESGARPHTAGNRPSNCLHASALCGRRASYHASSTVCVGRSPTRENRGPPDGPTRPMETTLILRRLFSVSASHARLFGACGCVSGREGPETNERRITLARLGSHCLHQCGNNHGHQYIDYCASPVLVSPACKPACRDVFPVAFCPMLPGGIVIGYKVI